METPNANNSGAADKPNSNSQAQTEQQHRSIITRLGDVHKYSPEWFQLKEQEVLLRKQHQAIIRRLSVVPKFSDRWFQLKKQEVRLCNEIGIVEDSAPVSSPTELNNPNDSGPVTPLCQHQQASSPNTAVAETEKEVFYENATSSSQIIGLEQITGDDAASVPLIEQVAAASNEKSDYKPKSMHPKIGLEHITGDDAAPVPPIQQVAAICDEKSDYKQTIPPRIGLEQVTGNKGALTQPLNVGDFEDSSNLNAAADFADVHVDDGDEPILPTNHQNSMVNTEPTTDMQMSTTPSDAQYENATTNESNTLLHDEENRNEHLVEAYLVSEDEDRTIYDATPELPWWRQRRIKVFILVICILLISLMAALLAPPPPTTLPTTSPTTSMSPSSSPHTSPKVSLIVVFIDITIAFIMNTEAIQEFFSSTLCPT
jgi:hypothetical protein